MDDLQQLHARFKQRSDFVLVYIAEAHAANEWPVGDQIVIDQPTNLLERTGVAKEFRDMFGFPDDLPIVVDRPGMESFDNLYACWPTRFYGVDSDGTIGYRAEPDASHEYQLSSLQEWLEDA